jgi:hypothetical protein
VCLTPTELLQSCSNIVIALSFLKELFIESDHETIPKDTATEIIDDNTTIYLHLQGIDAKKEVRKNYFINFNNRVHE